MPVDEFSLTAPRPPISPASSLSLSPGNVFEMKNQSPLGRKTFKVFLLLSDSIQSYPLAFSLQGLVPSQPALAQDQGLDSKLPLHRLTSTEHPPPWPTPLQLCPPSLPHPHLRFPCLSHSTLPFLLLPGGIHSPSPAVPQPLEASAAPQQIRFALEGHPPLTTKSLSGCIGQRLRRSTLSGE